jgi:hypothetical protein
VQTKTRISDMPPPFGPRNVALLLGLILAAAFFPVLLGGQTFCYRDFGVLAIPTASYHRASIWGGELPLWNPYSNCGSPFLAQWGTMVLYPLSLLYVLFPMPWSLNFFCILHLWIGGMGMYYLARNWMDEEWPAALAAVGFICTGITQATLSWPNYTAALGLLPWVILSVEGAWNASGATARYVWAAALLSAAQILTGVPEIAILTWMVLAVFWLQRLIATKDQRARLVACQIGIVAGAAALCAAQLLPFLQLLHYSQREPGFAAEKWALPIWGWADFILPRFHTFTTPEGTVFQYGQEFLSSAYIGAALLVLAVLAVLSRRPRMRTLGLFSIIAAVLALGSAGFVYPALTKLIPGFAIARYPVKFLFLLSFTIPLLAGFGAQALARAKAAAAQNLLAISLLVAGAIMGLLVALNYWQPYRYDRLREFGANSLARFGWLVLVVATLKLLASPRLERYRVRLQFCALLLLAVDGFTHLRNQNPVASARLFQPDVWASSQKFPKPEHGLGRAFITPRAEARLLHSNISDLSADLTGKRLALWSHLNLLDRVPKVNGSATLQLRDQAIVQKALYSETNAPPDAWLEFLNVAIQSSTNSPIEWDVRPGGMPFITAGQKPVQASPTLLTNPLPFGSEVALQPWSERFKEFASTAVELSEIEVRPMQVTFTAHSDKPAIAVLPVSWHPAWRARITQAGKSVSDEPLLKANLAFQALELPPGESRVRIYYHDVPFQIGAGISIATLLIGSTFSLRAGRKSNRSRQ